MSRWYEKLWYEKQPLHRVLIPFSWCYEVITYLRRACYRLGLFRVEKLPVPIIVVGNLTVGGTGKTPCVLAIATWLQQQGYRPGIVSRGYKSKIKNSPTRVNVDSSAREMGDEPVLLAKRSGCPVFIDPDRVRGAKALLDQTDSDILIADDGLQHYRLGRDIEILVVDGVRRWGNNYCLPAGPLREPIERAQTVDYIIATGTPINDEYGQTYHPGNLINIKNPAREISAHEIRGVVHAVAGIGNPQQFFDQLTTLGLQVQPYVYSDHADYTKTRLDFNDDLPVIMTEKDAVKCQEFAKDNWWYMPITAKLPDEFYDALSAHLNLAPRDGLEPPTK